MTEKQCPVCRKMFVPRNKNIITCSRTCGAEYRAEKHYMQSAKVDPGYNPKAEAYHNNPDTCGYSTLRR